MAAPTPPRTPTARKSLPGSPSATTPSVTALGSPISIQKRKWQGGNISLPLKGLTQPESANESAPLAQIMPAKRQKLGEEIKVEKLHQYPAMPVSPLRNQRFAQNPSSSPLRPPHVQQPGKPNLNDMPQKIFLAALQSNRTLVPANPVNNPLNSQRIDAIAHAMWQVIFVNENMMNGITTKASMLPQFKLRALARLNYLPSWWFIREMACGVMARQGWLMDDNEMQGLWKETVEWCERVEIKVEMEGDSATATKQEEQLVQAPKARELVMKVEP